MKALTEQQADAVYTILVEECGAPDDHLNFDHDSFIRYFTSAEFPEWRFSGDLGFGGKCRISSSSPVPYVNCYGEDRTSDREGMIGRANARIAELFGVEVVNA